MPSSKRSILPVVLPLLLLAIGGAAVWHFLFREAETDADDVPLYTVERGPLRVTVLESGSLEALDMHTVTSAVEGRSAILFIVPEGTNITPEDVAARKVLVQLDVSRIQEDLNRQAIEVAQATAARENAATNLDIQRQQNASDVRKAELDVRFARLDLERYVGKRLADILLEACACEREGLAPVSDDLAPPPAPDLPEMTTSSTSTQRLIATLLLHEQLEGEARQSIRKHDSDIGLADEEYRRQQVKLDWTRRLLEKGYVSRDEEEADRIALERRRVELERAKTAREQYATYDFRKEVERLLSDLLEAQDQLQRTIARTTAAEEQALADLRSRKEQESLKQARYEKIQGQLAAATIRADRPGLVVYASSQRRRRWGGGDRIQEGTEVNERQPIITIPNPERLGVKVSIHESVIERVSVGQSATVKVDALPDQPVPGRVAMVAHLPDPPDSWLNPDLKVYSTEIELSSIPPQLRPGMSAQVEILVADLADVTAVPVQAVAGSAENPVVYVMTPTGPVARPVELGHSNDILVEVRAGLEGGEQVLLAPPSTRGIADPGRGGRGAGRGDAKDANGKKAAPGSMFSKPAGAGGARGGRGGGGRQGSR